MIPFCFIAGIVPVAKKPQAPWAGENHSSVKMQDSSFFSLSPILPSLEDGAHSMGPCVKEGGLCKAGG